MAYGNQITHLPDAWTVNPPERLKRVWVEGNPLDPVALRRTLELSARREEEEEEEEEERSSEEIIKKNHDPTSPTISPTSTTTTTTTTMTTTTMATR